MMLNHRHTNRFLRDGVTLLELLITIGIILAITAAAIPVMAPALAGRRLREASRGVNVFLSTARNRAMVNGRATGVSFERLAAEPQAATVLHLVEVPPPWSGDTEHSRLRVDARGRIIGFVREDGQPAGDLGWINLIRPGDLVRLNHRGEYYRLWSGEPYLDLDGNGQCNGEPHVDCVVEDPQNPTYSPNINGGVTNPYGNDPAGPRYFTTPGPEAQGPNNFVPVNNNVVWTLGYDDPRMQLAVPQLAAGDYPFQIIRQPVKSQASSYQLPAGTVVDLSVSGVDSVFGPLFDPNPSGFGSTDNSPVVVLFSPNGALERIWCWQGSGQRTWKHIRPTSTLHFMLGKREAVGAPVGPLSSNPDEMPNWRDPDSLWVSVNSQTGMVMSNPNAPVDPSYDISAMGVPQGLHQARAFARQGQTMGGR